MHIHARTFATTKPLGARRSTCALTLALGIAFSPPAQAGHATGRFGAYMQRQFDVGEGRVHVSGTPRVPRWQGSLVQHGLLGLQNGAHALTIGAAIGAVAAGPSWRVLPALVLARAGLFAADATIGAVHWAFDNYMQPTTRFVGAHVKRFREHHDPRKSRAQGNASIPHLVSGFAPITTAAMIPALALGHDNWALMSFMSTFALMPWGFFFHSQAHKLPKEQGRLERAALRGLRWAKLAVRAEDHLRGHHGRGAAHAEHYATLTGESNRPFEKLKVFRRLERLIFARTGTMPNAWREEVGGAEVMAAALARHPQLKARAQAALTAEKTAVAE